jgi:hypothetical protein
MHLVCRQWTTSVRCNLHTMQPAALSTEQLKLYFPAVRHLFLNKVAFGQNSTLCLATLRKLQTLSLENCSFEKCESIAELAALSGKDHLNHVHFPSLHCLSASRIAWLDLSATHVACVKTVLKASIWRLKLRCPYIHFAPLAVSHDICRSDKTAIGYTDRP